MATLRGCFHIMKGIGLRDMGWVAQQWLSAYWRGRESCSHSTYKSRCLRSSSVVLKVWKIPRVASLQAAWEDRRSQSLNSNTHGGSRGRHTHTGTMEAGSAVSSLDHFVCESPVRRCWGWVPSTSQLICSGNAATDMSRGVSPRWS